MRPPIAVWRDWDDKIPLELPVDRLGFWISFLPSDARTLQRDGIHLFNIRYRISGATFFKWKAKYGGLEVSDAKRLKALEGENAKLKKLLAEAMLDNAMLKDVASKKW